MKKDLVFIISYLIAAWGLAGCSNMDATYVDFIRDGKIVYPGKADSVRVHPGKDRIQLSWLLIDPNVVKTRIYWNNRSGSVEIPVEQSPGTDSLQVMLSDMEEGSYTFEFYTNDDEGNESVKVEAPGQVYGNAYISSLLPKPVQHTIPGLDTTLVYWGDPTGDVIGTELEYTDQMGKKRRLFAPAGEEVTKLPDLEWGGDFRYTTLFLPDAMAIDTFYTSYDTVVVIEPGQNLALDKPVTASSDISAGRAENIVDDDHDTYWQPQGSDRDDLNIWTNIDLGTRHKLDEVHVYWSAGEGEEDQIASYQLLVSDDAENWVLAYEKASGIVMEEKITFPAEVTGRYLQLNITFKSKILLRTHAVEVY